MIPRVSAAHVMPIAKARVAAATLDVVCPIVPIAGFIFVVEGSTVVLRSSGCPPVTARLPKCPAMAECVVAGPDEDPTRPVIDPKVEACSARDIGDFEGHVVIGSSR